VRARLHPERVSLDVGDVNTEQALAAVASVIASDQRAHQDALLAELRQRHARDADGRAAIGLEQVLRALVERRVAALLYEPALRAAGVVCRRCGWMAGSGDRCPVDGSALERRDSIIEEAVQAAVGQSAEVLALRDRPELGPFGGVAATLRF
jgi:peptide subunit release factor 1 (eRF1)